MAAKWMVRSPNKLAEWLIDVTENGRVRITECYGPFMLPASVVSIDGAVAASVAKCITQAARLTKAKKAAPPDDP